MAFVYQPKKKTVSVWRPIEFMVSVNIGILNAEVIKVKIWRGGVLKTTIPVLFREFYVSNGEIDGGLRKFKFNVSPYVKEGVELFDGVKPMTMTERYRLANEMPDKRINSIVAFKVEVVYYVKNSEGVLEESVGSNESYPSGGGDWMYGVNHSPINGSDMYMAGYYPSLGSSKFLTNGKGFLKCGLNESLFLSFWIGDKTVEAVRVRRYQRNGHLYEGFYGWLGVSDWIGENYKILVSNVGVLGINGLLGGGMDNLVEGTEIFIDSETVRYEVQFISNVSEIIENEEEGYTNGDITYVGYEGMTETAVINVDVCESDGFIKRVHWLNRLGGIDSRSFKIFQRKNVKVKSIRDRKSLRWRGGEDEPNERDYRSIVRRKIESDWVYEVEEIVDNEESIWLEELLESPCIYAEDENGFISLVIDDGELVPSDTDEGMRVIKLKFIVDNVNIKIE